MFDIQLLENSPGTPSYYKVLITLVFAFFLSSLITITYEMTTKSIYKNAHFQQSLALISIVAAMIVQAIGDSVARGLGMLGAFAIIRFRTELNDPRNISFMFASLAAGIACGVFGFSIALTGTVIFCLAAIILRMSPYANPNELIGNLRIQVPKEAGQRAVVEKQLSKICRTYEMDQLRFLKPKSVSSTNEEGITIKQKVSRENLQEFTYLIRLENTDKITELSEALNELDGLEELTINFKKQPTKL